MSKRNNVNPGQYKVAGREKPGTPLGPEREHKQRFAHSKKQERAMAPEPRPGRKR